MDRKAYYREFYHKNKHKYAIVSKNTRVRNKLKVLDHYGNKCRCCSEDMAEFLTIDHINNDGAAHRKEIGARTIYKWLIKNNYPEGFQTLCMNCNFAKGMYGVCPHEDKRKRERGTEGGQSVVPSDVPEGHGIGREMVIYSDNNFVKRWQAHDWKPSLQEPGNGPKVVGPSPKPVDGVQDGSDGCLGS